MELKKVEFQFFSEKDEEEKLPKQTKAKSTPLLVKSEFKERINEKSEWN